MDIQEFRKTHPLPERVCQVAMDAARLARDILGPGIRVIWYGSWIRGNARPRSDIDLAVWSKKPIDPLKAAVLSAEIEEDFPSLFSISFANIQETGVSFRNEVFRTGVDI